MRKEFFDSLYEEMYQDERIVLLVGGLGFGGIEKIRDKFHNFYNFETSENAMIGAACGMARSGLIPIVYSITPFLLRHCYELISIYADYENIPIKLVGSGRGENFKECYSVDNVSHHAYDAKDILRNFPNIKQYWPEVKEKITQEYLKDILYNQSPSFLSLKR